MNVVTRQRSTGRGVLFVFEFSDEEEYMWFLRVLDTIAENAGGVYADRIRLFREKIKSRTDNKYAHDDVTLSSAVFADELNDFNFYLIFACYGMCNRSGQDEVL